MSKSYYKLKHCSILIVHLIIANFFVFLLGGCLLKPKYGTIPGSTPGPTTKTSIAATNSMVLGYMFSEIQSPLVGSEYAPTINYYYKNNNGLNKFIVSRGAVGLYTIKYPDQLSLVTSIKVTGVNGPCNYSAWNNTEATIRCYQNGALADTQFYFTFYGFTNQISSAQIVAFALADQESAGSYTINPNYSYNLSGDSITVNSPAPGIYTMNFSALDTTFSSVQISTYGDTSNYCNIDTTVLTQNEVTVKCYDNTGTTSDTKFTISITKVTSVPPINPAKLVSSMWSSIPNNGNPTNPWGGTNAITSLGTGQYRITYGNAALKTNPSLVQVSSDQYPTVVDQQSCSIISWDSSSVDVNCYNGGVPTDMAFVVTIFQAP